MRDATVRRTTILLAGASLAVAPLPPEDLVRLLRGVRIALDAGRTAEAVAEVRRAADAYPKEIAPLLTLWEYDQRFGLPETDAEKFRELLVARVADPSSQLPPGTLTHLVWRRGATLDELGRLEPALRARAVGRPDDVELLRELSTVQLRLDRPVEARDTLGRVLALAPDPRVVRECVSLDVRLERWESAERLLAGLPTAERDFVVDLWSVRVLSELGRIDALVSLLETLAARRELESRSSRPGATPRRGPLDEAWDQVLEAAWSLRDQGQDAEAERLFRRVLAARPDRTEAQQAVLQLYATEDEARARDAAEETRREGIEGGDALLQEGTKLLAAGDVEGALPLLERASAALPESEIAWFNLGLAAVRLERWDTAQGALSRAVRLNPARAEGALYLGVALRGLGRCGDAIRELDRSLTLAPELSAAHYYLFECHKALGHTAETLRHRTLYEQSRAE